MSAALTTCMWKDFPREPIADLQAENHASWHKAGNMRVVFP
jgi:hypothetical protein